MWFVKSKRAQSVDDDETWIAGGVAPTLNAFDNGDTRATVIIIMRQREGKPGGGKGPMLGDKSFTLATNNDQTMFVFYGNRVNDIRIQDDKINTLQARMGTGGNNMPMVAKVTPIHDKATRFNGKRKLHNGEYALDGAGNGLGIGKEGDPMNTLTQGDRHAVATSVVRRLTPTECERLQGFPDGWTAEQPDSHRYKQMGNAVAVPVVDWIIGNLVK